MERKIRKFKRTYHKEVYGDKFRNEMGIRNFRNKNYNPLETEIRCEIVKRDPFTKKIKELPKDIQHRIYIFAMRNYWKYMMEKKPLKPMWCDYKKYVDNEIKKSIIDNVHFMHLEFNTLPEYKKWIPGCQCDYCIRHHKYKIDDYEKIVDDESHFFKTIQCNDLIVNHWNKHLLYHTYYSEEEGGIVLTGSDSIRIFDYLKGYLWTVYDQIKLDPNDSPIYFSNEIG